MLLLFSLHPVAALLYIPFNLYKLLDTLSRIYSFCLHCFELGFKFYSFINITGETPPLTATVSPYFAPPFFVLFTSGLLHALPMCSYGSRDKALNSWGLGAGRESKVMTVICWDFFCFGTIF